ncbi:hypothetical protein Zmor_021569 [Zophobas morio]|uniref:DUF5641 domain-containing protein n=1 Tax=Zophobas morio TaxID=2755281 RepID=A0AA38MB94_9CUCU|nr:hypothetical protein Zmor_021569 [Zophobas morio]
MVMTRSQTFDAPHMAGAEGDDNAETFSDSNPTPEDAGNLQILLLKRDRIHDEISRFKLWFETNNLSTSASRLRVRLRDFVRIKAQFDKIHSQIEALDDATPDLEQATTRLYFENAYYDLCADVEDAIEQKRINTSSPAPQGNAPTSTPSPSVQLLPNVIKPFSGIYTEWLPFYNTFKTQKVSTFTAAVNRNSTQSTCYFCKKSHLIYNCVTFSKLSVSERRSQVDRLKLCQNCLKPSHTSDSCKSMSCKLCQLKHNTLLHSDQPSHSNENQPSTSGVYCSSALFPQAVLSTAIIVIKDCKNKFQKFRALLDVGSESHFITEAATNKLGLSTENANVVVAGIQCSNTTARQKVQVQIESLHYSFTTALNCLVIPKISKNIPVRPFSKDELDIPEAVKLADPNFNLSQPIDLLIGAGLFWQLLCVGQIQTIGHGLILQKTLLGWIVGGPLHGCPTCNTRQNLHCAVNNVNLENQVEKFWKLESYSNDDKPPTALEIQHENYFINNATRLSNGRFQVRLTFSKSFPILSNSKETALQRLYSSELKFAKNIMLEINYHNFIKENINLNHMLLLGSLTEQKIESEPRHFLPHHAVSKNDAVTEKICVVFDGSVKPLVRKSINACLSTGPKIQNDIFYLIIGFRTYRFAFTADICKMYRQILFQPEDRRYEKTLWWDDPVLYQARVTLAKRASNTNLLNDLTTNHINFHFIPPSAPHMGTIGEAMVKSAKSQLKRVTGIFLFNLQEMQTLQIQVETCLNSYPLTAMSKDPNDLTPLIPGHFLVGTPLTVIPEDNVTTVSTNRLSRWQQFSRTQQQFWKRWTAEHMGQLHHRPKWTKASRNSIRWTIWWSLRKTTHLRLYGPLGRVITVHPGLHGPIRVVTVRTAHDVINLQVTKLCVLPT